MTCKLPPEPAAAGAAVAAGAAAVASGAAVAAGAVVASGAAGASAAGAAVGAAAGAAAPPQAASSIPSISSAIRPPSHRKFRFIHILLYDVGICSDNEDSVPARTPVSPPHVDKLTS